MELPSTKELFDGLKGCIKINCEVPTPKAFAVKKNRQSLIGEKLDKHVLEYITYMQFTEAM